MGVDAWNGITSMIDLLEYKRRLKSNVVPKYDGYIFFVPGWMLKE